MFSTNVVLPSRHRSAKRSLACGLRLSWALSAVLVLLSTSLALALDELKGPDLGPPVEIKVTSDFGQTDRHKIAAPTQVADFGDFYLTADRSEVHLLRAEDEVAVRYKPGVDPGQGRQALQDTSGIPALDVLAQPRFGDRGGPDVLRSRQKGAKLDAKGMVRSPLVAFAYTVLVDPASHCRMIPTDEVLVRLIDGVSPADLESVFAAAGLELVEKTGAPGFNTYLFKLTDPQHTDPLVATRIVAGNASVVWAEPNFVREIDLSYTPNDPLFYAQQSMHNTGQNGGVVDADVNALDAWNTTTGSSSVVIAIIDDGVDTSHADLNIAPGGYDFANNDSNPSPVGTNGHGTGCAGVAAAIINNSYRVAGIAGGCKILPVKIIDDAGVFSTDQVIGNAISYAADHADVLNNSWGGGSPSSYISNAVSYANSSGRGGKGCPVFFATGNSASKWNNGGGRMQLSVGTALGSGTYSFGFRYSKDSIDTIGEDLVKIDNVVLLDGDGYTHLSNALGTNGRQDFEGAFPPAGWTLSSSTGSNLWTSTTSGVFLGTTGSTSMRSGAISHSQWTELRTPNITLAGDETLVFSYYISSEYGYDGLNPRVYNSSGTYLGQFGMISGEPLVQTSIAFPSSLAGTYSGTCAVGASTDCDRRSDYSQYGTGLDFVASSNGGWNDIATLDPTGSVGWNSTDFKMNFGGTSSACPLAAGISALVLSKNPNLTASQVRTIMRDSCDKIGGVTYSGGWNQYYGYGRINAKTALDLTSSSDITPPTVSTVAVQTSLTVDVTFSEAMGAGVTTAGNYTVSGTGKGTLASNPSSVALVSGNKYRLTWTSGEMKNGGDITITVANAQDLATNVIGSPNYGTHTGGGIGTAPTVTTVAVQTSLTVDVTFSEAMGTGVTTAGNYTVSGTGKGTLASNPNSVALVSGNKYRLTWTSGEMKNGGNITITVASAQDLATNVIGSPNYGTHTSGGIGTAPTVSSVVRKTPTTQYYNGSSVVWTVTFNETIDATTVSTGDFTLVDVSGTITGESITNVTPTTGTATAFDVTASTGTSGNGTLRLNVIGATATINDVAGNDITADYITGETYIIDKTPPSAPTAVTDEGVYTPSTSELVASWSGASDAQSGIATYWYAIGTTAGDNDISDWAEVTDATVTRTGLTLSAGSTYYFSVMARNGAGTWSASAADSDGIKVVADTGTVSDAKALDNAGDKEVALLHKALTANFGDCIYIQEQPTGKFGAIKVAKDGLSYTPGSYVDVAGLMNVTANGERVILSPTVKSGAGVKFPKPLLIVGRDLGGEPLNGFTPGIPAMVGPNNLGLLVNIYGKLTKAESGYWLVDDGGIFQYDPGIQYQPGVHGVSVDVSKLSASKKAELLDNDFVVITGICIPDTVNYTVHSTVYSLLVPTVKLRGDADVIYYRQP